MRADAPQDWIEAHGDLLDDCERQRAAELRGGPAHASYVVGHIATRLAVAAWIGCDPRAVVVDRRPCRRCGRPHGKPWVHGAVAPEISLSRTEGWAVVALGRDPLGVDVEGLVVPSDGMMALACTPQEGDGIRDLPPMGRAGAFTRLWSRKEATLKVSGIGLDADPAALALGLAPTARWSGGAVSDLVGPDDRTVCAVAWAGSGEIPVRTGLLRLAGALEWRADPAPEPVR